MASPSSSTSSQAFGCPYPASTQGDGSTGMGTATASLSRASASSVVHGRVSGDRFLAGCWRPGRDRLHSGAKAVGDPEVDLEALLGVECASAA